MRIAVVGTGIAGLTSAWLLQRQHQVTVFEKNDYIGGHTATKMITVEGKEYPIDTGFIVFNDRTYPYFRAMMRELGVSWRDTEMSFSVRDPSTGIEYNGNNLNTLFAQRKNIISPKFWRLIGGILKFNKAAKAAYAVHGDALDNKTLGEFITELKLSAEVSELYLLPMVAAIWSASLSEAEAFPLGFFLRFFNNHGLLNVADRPQWHTIVGGSASYIEPLTQSFAEQIHLNAQIRTIHRAMPDRDGAITIEFNDGQLHDFDEVVLACHSDEALQLLAQPSAQEQAVLSAIPYQLNDVVLHTDERILPRNQRAWASWNYLLHTDDAAKQRPSSVSYNMNILQGIDAPVTFCVTLNNSDAIQPQQILGRYSYAHPVYSVDSMAARQQRELICGHQHTHFVGAYWYNGFHEDGVRSAVDVAKRLGVAWHVS